MRKVVRKTSKPSDAAVPPFILGKNEDFASAVGRRFPYAAVLLLCVVFAIQLGVQEQYLAFQKTGEQVVVGCSSLLSSAYAVENQVLFYVPDETSSSAFAVFEGEGKVEGVELGGAGSSALNLTHLRVNGQEVCGPCSAGKHMLAHSIDGRVEVEAQFDAVMRPMQPPGAGMAFFEKQLGSYIEAPFEMKLVGGWSSTPNAQMPSSFYGTDAPFHIRSIKEMGGGFANGRLPSLSYPFVGDLGGALIYFIFNISSQYAYKLYEIALFFVPIAIFFLYSRKLPVHGAAAFLFASLIYLYLPASGYPMGGGTDLFVYGMTPHTVATYFSLLFLLFAYECVFEKKGLVLPSVFFLLAVMANPRIVFSLAICLAVLLGMAIAHKKVRRLALVCAACCGACAWFLAGVLSAFNFSSYGVVEGAAINGELEGLAAFWQSGYLLLPVLFAAGCALAVKQRAVFVLCLSGVALAVLLCATSPGINKLLPFLDGLRFLPSFFLPMFFVCGFGAACLFGMAAQAVEGLARRFGMDRTTFGGAVVFGVIVPCAIFASSLMLLVNSSYSDASRPPALAAEYLWQQQANAMIDGKAAWVGRGQISQYPIYEGMGDRSAQAGVYEPGKLYESMAANGERFAIFGNYLAINYGEADSLRALYENVLADPRFAEVVSSGPGRVVELSGKGGAGRGNAQRVAGYRWEIAAAGLLLMLLCAYGLRQEKENA